MKTTSMGRRLTSLLGVPWVVPVVLVVVACAFVTSMVLRQLPFSPFDEYVYLDYLDKSLDQVVVPTGDEVGAVARGEIECRGVLGYGLYGDGCGGSVDADSLFPYGGGTGADIYSPVGFWLTNLVAQPLTWLGVSLLDAGRLAGTAWASAMLLGITFALRRLGVAAWLQLAVPLVVLATPVSFWSFSFLSTDASVLAAGGLLTWLTIRAMQGGSTRWIMLVSVVAVLCKVQSLAVVGASLLTLLVHAWWTRRQDSRALLRRTLAIMATAVLAIGVQGAWLIARASAAIAPAPNLGVAGDQLPLANLLRQTGIALLRAGESGSAPGVVGTVLLLVLSFVVPLAVGAGLLGLGRRMRSPEVRAMSIAALLLGVAGVPAFTLMTWVLLGIYVEPPVRYGAAMLPLLATIAGVLAMQVIGRRWGIAIAGGSLLLAMLVWFRPILAG